MADRYQQFTKTPVGKFVVPKLGLPNPATLRRYQPGQPALEGPALLGAAPGGRLEKTLRDQLADAGIDVVTAAPPTGTLGARLRRHRRHRPLRACARSTTSSTR